MKNKYKPTFLIILLLWISCVHAVEEGIEKKDVKTSIYLVRHGQTEWNALGLIQGWSDIPLNDTGRFQALLLAEKLNGTKISLVFSSDLKRAYETAMIIAGTENQVIIDSRLRERNYGSLEGHSWIELEKIKTGEFSDIENDESLETRIFDFFQEVVTRYKGEKILVVTHWEVLAQILLRTLAIGCQSEDIHIDNTAIIEFSYKNGQWSINNLEGIRFRVPFLYTS